MTGDEGAARLTYIYVLDIMLYSKPLFEKHHSPVPGEMKLHTSSPLQYFRQSALHTTLCVVRGGFSGFNRAGNMHQSVPGKKETAYELTTALHSTGCIAYTCTHTYTTYDSAPWIIAHNYIIHICRASYRKIHAHQLQAK